MDVVSSLRRRLAATLGQDRYDLWFGGAVRWNLEDTTIVVSVRDQFTLERVRRQFGRELAGLAATEPDGPWTIRLEVGAVEPAVRSERPAEPEALPTTDPDTRRNVEGEDVSPRRSPEPIIRLERGGKGAETGAPRGRTFAQFTGFVVGAGNRVAYTAAREISQRPGAVTPLFLYGPTGTGKTHLLEAIWSATRRGTRPWRSLFLSAEQFTSSFLEALQGGGLPGFRRRVRDVDLLILDDIHFFSGKRATLVEFQHTLDALARQGRQVVVSADCGPQELTGLGSDLVARLSGGLVCGLEPADAETRRELLRQVLAREQFHLPTEVVELIASGTTGDARQLIGAVHRLRATSLALAQPITMELARSSLSDLLAAASRAVRLPDIERAVCDVFGLEARALREGGKARSASHPRMLAMWLARKHTRMAFSEISEYFGRRSHTTVITAEQNVNRWRSEGASLQLGGQSWSTEEAIRRLEARLRTG